MKKWSLFLLLFMLAGCSQTTDDTPVFSADQAVPFEIVAYEEMISPVFTQMAPYIMLAKTEEQLNRFLTQFDIEASIDMTQFDAALFVAVSDSCGIAVDGVYATDDKLAVQFETTSNVTTSTCDTEPMPHTFVLAVEKQDYAQVQLYDGPIIKSSLNLK